MGLWQKFFGAKQHAPTSSLPSNDAEPEREIKTGKELTSSNRMENTQMQEELITSENLNIELVKSVFDSAFMDATLDDGEVIVQDAIRVRIKVNQERKDRINLYCVFGFKSTSSQIARLQCANQINVDYLMVRAAVIDDILLFSYDLIVTGGITKKELVMTLKRFAGIPQAAVREFGNDIVE